MTTDERHRTPDDTQQQGRGAQGNKLQQEQQQTSSNATDTCHRPGMSLLNRGHRLRDQLPAVIRRRAQETQELVPTPLGAGSHRRLRMSRNDVA